MTTELVKLLCKIVVLVQLK